MDDNTYKVLHEIVQAAPLIIGALSTGLAGYATAKATSANKNAKAANAKADTNAESITRLRNGEGEQKIVEVLAKNDLVERRVSDDNAALNERRARKLRAIADKIEGKEVLQNGNSNP